MPDEIFVDPDVATSNVIRVGGDCYARVGPSGQPPAVHGPVAGYEDCDACTNFVGHCPGPTAPFTPSETIGNTCEESPYTEDADCDGTGEVSMPFPAIQAPIGFTVTFTGVASSGCCSNKSGGGYYQSSGYSTSAVNGTYTVLETDVDLDGGAPYSKRIIISNVGKVYNHDAYADGYANPKTGVDTDDPPCQVTPHGAYSTSTLGLDLHIELRYLGGVLADNVGGAGPYPCAEIWLRANGSTSGHPGTGTTHDAILLFETSMCYCCDQIRSSRNWFDGTRIMGGAIGTFDCNTATSVDEVCICDDSKHVIFSPTWAIQAGGLATWAPLF